MHLSTLDAIDSKIGILFSTSSALLGILAAVIALRSGRLGVVEYAAVAISIVTYLIVARHSERAYRCRDWKVGPNLKHVYRLYRDDLADEVAVGWEVANQFRLDYEANKDEEVRKSDALGVILLWVVTQSLVLVAALALVAAGA
ncbi:MAG: hypothetical protein ACJ76I_04075 [Gaiellaceae bacterium]